MSQIVKHGNTVYLAGQVAFDAPGESVTKQTENIEYMNQGVRSLDRRKTEFKGADPERAGCNLPRSTRFPLHENCRYAAFCSAFL